MFTTRYEFDLYILGEFPVLKGFLSTTIQGVSTVHDPTAMYERQNADKPDSR